MQTNNDEIFLELTDNEWEYEFTDNDRVVARAMVFDDDGYFYFVRSTRSDAFGSGSFIETSGGGVEAGETLESAIKRELKEELGTEVEVLRKIGVVSDYYNLIHRHNINHYFLCRVTAFGERRLTQDEEDVYHLQVVKMTLNEAVGEYEKCARKKLGRLIAARELPILRKAAGLLLTGKRSAEGKNESEK